MFQDDAVSPQLQRLHDLVLLNGRRKYNDSCGQPQFAQV